MKLRLFPDNFPYKGMYRTWTSSWTPLGYATEPQYNGQQPVSYPVDARPIECFLGGYIIVDDS